MVWNLFPFKGDFSFGKSQKLNSAKSGLWGRWVTWVIRCFAKKLCMRSDSWAGALLWWSCQSPVPHKQLNHLNIFCGGMFKLNAKFDVDSLFYLLSHLNVTATQYTCTLNSIYFAPWLVQWSRYCSFMRIPVHYPWLPGYISGANCSHYINNGWTFSRQTSYKELPRQEKANGVHYHQTSNIWNVKGSSLRRKKR